MIHVEAILFASLAASLLSAFLAMLGKQWLNRYASTDMRGSTIERSQNRQQKLDGIVTWYFHSVMESLPLMLQVALLLLGCALSRYLWEISRTIASVVIGVTSFGLLFYLFILVVGTAWESCPYQTPGSHFFRYLGPKIRSIINPAASAPGIILKESKVVSFITDVGNNVPESPWAGIVHVLVALVTGVPIAFAVDVYHLGQAAVRALVTLPIKIYHLLRKVYAWLHTVCTSLLQGFDLQTAILDLRCISWALQTSLEKPVHLSTLEHLITITEFTAFDPTLVTDCFNIFAGCISVTNGKVVTIQGLEQLATLSAGCLFHTSRHLSATNPTSGVLADLRRRSSRVFPLKTDFRGLPFYHAITNIHALANQGWNPRHEQWASYSPPSRELIPFSRHMVDAARTEYQQDKKVPCWILRFALRFLSLEPPSSSSVIADCLTIIAIALDYNLSSVSTLDERYIHPVLRVPTSLTNVQHTNGPNLKPHNSQSRNHGFSFWCRSDLPVQAQGHQCTNPVCSPSGARRTVVDD